MTDGEEFINGSTNWRRAIPMAGLMLAAYLLGVSFYLRQQWWYAGICLAVGAVHTYILFQTRGTEQ